MDCAVCNAQRTVGRGVSVCVYALVVRVGGDELAHPGGHGGDLAGGAALDELEVLLHGAVRVRVHVHAGQVGLDERDEAREHALLAADDLVHGQLEVLVARVGRVRRHVAGRAHVAPPPEALLRARAAPLRALHVLVHLRTHRATSDYSTPSFSSLLLLLGTHLADGHHEVELVGEDDAREQDHEAHVGGVLEVRELRFARAELHAPADARVGRRRLEAHRLPVCRLDVLPMNGQQANFNQYYLLITLYITQMS